MKILFITDSLPNFVPDILLHGLRKIMGPDVVDYPRKDCLYQGILGLGVCPEDQKSPDWFPSDDGQINRDDIPEKVNKGYFNYVICDVRAVSFFQANFSQLSAAFVLIDGEDGPAKIKPNQFVVCRRETDGSDFSIPLPMAMPEEILNWITSYDNTSKQYSIGFLGSMSHGKRKEIAETIGRLYPDALFQTSEVPFTSAPSPEGRLSRDDYYRSLQQCRIVLSLPGNGNDTFRFWENAACNAAHVSSKMPLYIPNDFVNEKHIFRFSDIDDLKRIVNCVLEGKVKSEEIIQEGRNHLIKFHLSTKRAQYFLDRIEKAFAK